MLLSRRAAIAFAISISFHAVLFTALAWQFAPGNEEPPAPPEPPEEALEIVVQPPPEPAPAVAASMPSLLGAAAEQTELDSATLKAAEKAPENAEILAARHALAARMRGVPAAAPALPRPTPLPQKRAPGEEEETALALQPAPGEAAGEGGEDDASGRAAIGAWKKAVANAIGQRWNFYRESKLNLLAAGSVRIKFVIDAEGRVSGLNVVANSAGPGNALYAVRAITEATIPPIPPDRLARTPGRRVEVEYSFTLFPSQ